MGECVGTFASFGMPSVYGKSHREKSKPAVGPVSLESR